MAFDAEGAWELPETFCDAPGERRARDPHVPQASPTCLTVPVLHSQDVEVPEDFPPDQPLPEAEVEVVVAVSEKPDGGAFECFIQCPSGRLTVGDAENERVVEVPAGRLRIGVAREPDRFAERVRLQVSEA
jgi:hypothetical protein